MLREALRKGIQVEVHAIGDSANRLLLNEFEAAFNDVPSGEQRRVKEPRWRDEHTQIVDPADLPRFKQLGVIPSMQPSHAIGDLYFAPSRLGSERLAGAYAWQTLLKDGNFIAGGSDAPVERGEPMIEFYAAVARRSISGDQTPGLASGAGDDAGPGAPRVHALAGLRGIRGERAGQRDGREVGRLHDPRPDIMTIPEAEILTTKNVMTVVNGEIVYSAK